MQVKSWRFSVVLECAGAMQVIDIASTLMDAVFPGISPRRPYIRNSLPFHIEATHASPCAAPHTATPLKLR